MAREFKEMVRAANESSLKRTQLNTVQVNLGDKCNQRCLHCHVNSSPAGEKIMPARVMDDIVGFFSRSKGLCLDITGGCPELNPNFRYFIEKAGVFVKSIIVRNNLTVFFEPGMEWLPGFYAGRKIKLTCSLPCYTRENVDSQRGEGVFEKSIRALRLLNSIGYARADGLEIDLVYNPGGVFLPGKQDSLEAAYRENLKGYGVAFNHLITITNAPINRFRRHLEVRGNFEKYMKLLTDNFNREVVDNIMCRSLLSVGHDGIIYDCDFNQALGLSLRDASGKIMEIRSIAPEDIEGKEIIFENHCYCCTAGAGSSCKGALAG